MERNLPKEKRQEKIREKIGVKVGTKRASKALGLFDNVFNYKKTVKYFDTERRMAFSGNFEELAFADSIKEKEIDLSKYDLKYKLDFMKKYHSGYPKQENEHNALDDAKWNFNLFQFIQGLK